ncbi:hypothetical protein [Pseudoalteromonas sp. S16_S37]|uniref:hypothetical protein n=1 Tax=Pseudoalteromonas sp. S16_S37 TaxID=2720228 RepID=UPI00167FF5F8|nr:hypothetical protein [Pseudoalteromonas sp. S16_S37]MBD1584963.1 hypothetical protein [Pseudoalteromonas sp. S16_S37]
MKYQLLSTLLCLGLSTLSYAEQLTVNGDKWLRTANSHYAYYAEGSGTHDILAWLSLLDDKIDFRLVWKDEKLCSNLQNKPTNNTLDNAIILVNNRKVKFSYLCDSNKQVHFTPENQSRDGLIHILKSFRRARGNPVKFVYENAQTPDAVYMVPSEGFTAFYAELKEATKSAL